MATLQSNRIKTSYGRLTYLYDTPAHDGSDQRVLATTGQNVRLLHDPGGAISDTQSAAYLQRQYARVQGRAKNNHKTYQAESVIISFSDTEFPPSGDLRQQAQQAIKLTSDYARDHFPPNTQWVAAAQRDGEGHKLHVHLLVNTVQTDGKVVRTCRFHIPTQRHDLNNVLKVEMPQMGLTWDDPQSKQHKTRANVPTDNVTWQDAVKNAISDTLNDHTVVDMATFESALADRGVTITQRRGGWTYHDADGHKSRDFYQRINKQTGEIKSTRGLGRAYMADNIAELIKTRLNEDNNNITGKAVNVDHTGPNQLKKEADQHDTITNAIRSDRIDAAVKLRASIEATKLRRSRQVQQTINERETDDDQRQAQRRYNEQRASRAVPHRNRPTRRPNREAGGPGL
ncbi:relaxase/mobilization nuclease domain-containing protein [Lactiplantibacillus nangangensis]|uniref:Relaxase/mobilization nuclease domain-containing protein n=1 Tax=Lactiplantibacillus nangangensis TaxID=2559917 RepID=A0ABW1SL37_9LACO|nr:relaxase/mobilization nuclease domain-containing protein [Lactiplantibacillus nangangensis]